MGFFKLRSIHILHNKHTAQSPAVRMTVPKTVSIPMSMHIGAPAVPAVKVGDTVKKGQLIANAGGFVSSPIYASISGKVKKIEDCLLAGGNYSPSVVIESDGLDEMYEGLSAKDVNTFEDFINAVRESGVVGLGGAGFPTHVKLGIKDMSQLENIIINCAECEGYITSDTRTLIDNTEELFDAIRLLKKFYGEKRIIIGIEDNKQECIDKLKPLCSQNGVEMAVLPSTYPTGGEKVLVYNITGRVIPEGKLPLDVGAIVINCTTLVAIDKYIRTGVPLIEKTVTIAGSAIKNPQNVIAPIGASVKDVVEFTGGYGKEPKKIIYGGPMMGIAMPNDSCVILKNTNAVLAFDETDARLPEETDCINCGRCVAHCPMKLMPAQLLIAYNSRNADRLKELKVGICMECGCCSYVCPAKKPLVQTNKLAKAFLKAQGAQKK